MVSLGAYRSIHLPARGEETRKMGRSRGKIWIDLDNSPHVPFFVPIIAELQKRNYDLVVTARDCFQVRELCELYRLKYRLIGHHSGKNIVRKMAGLFARALHLVPAVLGKGKPDLALSVCSRSQLIVSSLLRIPIMFMGDYEHATGWVLVHPTWIILPEVIPSSVMHMPPDRMYKFPGIKEDVYVPRFVPSPGIRAELGLREEDVVVTVRPPANEAHYYVPESDTLFDAAVDFISKSPGAKLVALPRNDRQASDLRKRWPDLFSSGAMRIPDHVVNGLNLIWHSEFVVSGGGTMNREAAALGVPVYSVFRGKIGAVDRYLSSRGRLVLLESTQDVQTKVAIIKRERPAGPEKRTEAILQGIINHITTVMDGREPMPTVRVASA